MTNVKTYRNYPLFIKYCISKSWSYSQNKYLPTFTDFAKTENLTANEYNDLQFDLTPVINWN